MFEILDTHKSSLRYVNQLDAKLECGSNFNRIVLNALTSSSPVAISFLNPFSYRTMEERNDVASGIDTFFADGALLCLLHRIFYRRINRASFDYSSIAEGFFSLAEQQGHSIALIGATPHEIELARTRIKIRFPRLQISYVDHGYHDSSLLLAEKIKQSGVRIVILGMGSPKQEEFAVRLKEAAGANLILTCGGFFTQTSLRDDYYFPIIKRLGLRWLQRMVMHSHVRTRVCRDYPIFLLNYLRTHYRRY
jgi:exopolysaccharide biosynthesis WecB/TagA/CpsF family protein